ncbi:hypothetical protein GH714_036392 [Hevea brasiliensis]|uniref:Uncharacterized protein n=1 Tax=Hevea brasiliensis TaxID=3981 RepID=A0A6A6KL03_HEVBR|nr:hypothetical protein GH714_036392 [Hevea brasiliensis]
MLSHSLFGTMDVELDQKQEALRLKAIAETKYTSDNIKSALKHAKKAHCLCPNLDGLSSILTALKILRVVSKTHSDITDWYKILQVEEGDKEGNGIGAGVRVRSERLRRKVVVAEVFRDLGSKQKMGNVDSRVKSRGGGRIDELRSAGNIGSGDKVGTMGLRSKAGVGQVEGQTGRSANLKVNERGSGEWSGGRLRTVGLRRKMSTVDEVLERSKPKRVKVGADMMTLAEMQLEAKQKAFKEKAKLKEREKQKDAVKKRSQKRRKNLSS